MTTDYTWSYTDYYATQWKRIGHLFGTEYGKTATRSFVMSIKKMLYKRCQLLTT